jgi:hypothetical protein
MDPTVARCPFCGAQIVVWIGPDDVKISHTEPECSSFRRYCDAERFEPVELASYADRKSR